MMDRYGLFRLESGGFAVPLERMLRVIEAGQVTWLPLMPEQMAGMLIVDKRPVPLLDTSWLHGTKVGAGLSAPYQVLIATEFGPVALPADTTVGIVATGRGIWASAECDREYFLSESFCYRGGIYPVLNVDKFIMSLTRS